MSYTLTYKNDFDTNRIGCGQKYDIRDIAHALSMLVRFNGHISEPYTVAQHCVLVAHNIPWNMALYGLLHDAAEAYIGDLPAPHKHCLRDYCDLENEIMEDLIPQFGLQWPFPDDVAEIVKNADWRMLLTEAHRFFNRPPELLNEKIFRDGVEPYPNLKHMTAWSHKKAESEFIFLYNELTEKEL